MKRIVECLLEEGIDESMIHRILDLIESKYENVNDIPDDKPCAMAWKNPDNTYKVVTFKNKTGKLNDSETNQHLDNKTFKSVKAADNYASKKGYAVHSVKSKLK